jgi:MFS family permease
LAGLATWLRSRTVSGSGNHSATYYLDALAWMLAVLGAVLIAWIGEMLLSAGHRQTRRRAILLALVGLGAAIIACATIPVRTSTDAGLVIRVLLAGLMVGGFGVGLSGLATLLWFFGGRYTANRIQRLGEDDW